MFSKQVRAHKQLNNFFQMAEIVFVALFVTIASIRVIRRSFAAYAANEEITQAPVGIGLHR